MHTLEYPVGLTPQRMYLGEILRHEEETHSTQMTPLITHDSDKNRLQAKVEDDQPNSNTTAKRQRKSSPIKHQRKTRYREDTEPSLLPCLLRRTTIRKNHTLTRFLERGDMKTRYSRCRLGRTSPIRCLRYSHLPVRRKHPRRRGIDSRRARQEERGAVAIPRL